MKSEQYINEVLKRWEGHKKKALKNENTQKLLEACAVIRTLRIILEENKK